MSLLTNLLIIILAAGVLGRIFERFNQPAILGEMIAGILLGPTVFGIISVDKELSAISELAVFLVVLSAGLETNFKNINAALYGKGFIIALLSFIIPMTAGLLVGYYFNLPLIKTIFLALCISITALPVAIQILRAYKMLNTDIAHYSLATAIFNDILAMIILGVLLNLPENYSLQHINFLIFIIGLKLLVFIAIIFIINWIILDLIKQKLLLKHNKLKLFNFLGSHTLFSTLVLFVLFFGAISEILGFQFIIGVFFGALLIDKKIFLASHYSEFERNLDAITGFLAPVFFAFIGLKFNLLSMPSYAFILIVFLVSISTKIFAGWFGGILIRLSSLKSFGIGIILNSRGLMELVIVSIGYQHGLIDQGIFSTLVLMGVITTLITPLMFQRWIVGGRVE